MELRDGLAGQGATRSRGGNGAPWDVPAGRLITVRVVLQNPIYGSIDFDLCTDCFVIDLWPSLCILGIQSIEGLMFLDRRE